MATLSAEAVTIAGRTLRNRPPGMAHLHDRLSGGGTARDLAVARPVMAGRTRIGRAAP
jgi:hypothetical protein